MTIRVHVDLALAEKTATQVSHSLCGLSNGIGRPNLIYIVLRELLPLKKKTLKCTLIILYMKRVQ